jgi:SatD family (SatD)
LDRNRPPQPPTWSPATTDADATDRPHAVPAVALIGDVTGSRALPSATAWLDALCGDLNERYRADLVATFKRTKGDEVQGLLRPDADVMAAYLHYALAGDRLPMRWSIVSGEADAGEGPATDWTGQVLVAASDTVDAMKHTDDLLRIATGDAALDERLAVFGPWIADWAFELTAKQRTIIRSYLGEPGRPQSRTEVARETEGLVDPSLVYRVLRSRPNRRMLSLIGFVSADIARAGRAPARS